MNFSFTEEQLMIQQAARDFAERELLPDIIERDTNARFPTEQVKKLAELGFLGMMTDPKYDGGGMDTVSYVLAMEEISKIDGSTSVIMSVCNSLVNWGLETYGTEEQKEKYLKPLARGEKIGAFLLSEPEAGSDATKQRTTAVDMGDHYLLNGTKNWITNAACGSVYLVIAHTTPEKGHKGINAFIVEKEWPGITLGPHEDKMGMRSSDTHSVMFTDVSGAEARTALERKADGFKIAMKLLDGGRIGIAAQALGIGSRSLMICAPVTVCKREKSFRNRDHATTRRSLSSWPTWPQ
jgi:alkylation response protein AidB-like acyl-CoA dehydrogenase